MTAFRDFSQRNASALPWVSFESAIANGPGVTMFDDHHFGGSIKHLYCSSDKSYLLMLGVYGVDEVCMDPARPKSDYIFHGIAPLLDIPNHPSSLKSHMQIFKPLSREEMHHVRKIETTWSLQNGVPTLTFDDERLDETGKSIKNFWRHIPGEGGTERASLLKVWEASRNQNDRLVA